MFRHPDFFKVGVSQAGNHDNRNYEDDWAEKWQGLLERKPDGTTNYDDQANQNHAKNLKGKLLIAHGTMDANVPPYNTLMVVNELIKANKDFDFILLPESRPRVRQRALHDPAPLGLLREAPDGRRAAEGIRVEAAHDRGAAYNSDAITAVTAPLTPAPRSSTSVSTRAVGCRPGVSGNIQMLEFRMASRRCVRITVPSFDQSVDVADSGSSSLSSDPPSGFFEELIAS